VWNWLMETMSLRQAECWRRCCLSWAVECLVHAGQHGWAVQQCCCLSRRLVTPFWWSNDVYFFSSEWGMNAGCGFRLPYTELLLLCLVCYWLVSRVGRLGLLNDYLWFDDLERAALVPRERRGAVMKSGAWFRVRRR
jgi:hypothetical protein